MTAALEYKPKPNTRSQSLFAYPRPANFVLLDVKRCQFTPRPDRLNLRFVYAEEQRQQQANEEEMQHTRQNVGPAGRRGDSDDLQQRRRTLEDILELQRRRIQQQMTQVRPYPSDAKFFVRVPQQARDDIKRSESSVGTRIQDRRRRARGGGGITIDEAEEQRLFRDALYSDKLPYNVQLMNPDGEYELAENRDEDTEAGVEKGSSSFTRVSTQQLLAKNEVMGDSIVHDDAWLDQQALFGGEAMGTPVMLPGMKQNTVDVRTQSTRGIGNGEVNHDDLSVATDMDLKDVHQKPYCHTSSTEAAANKPQSETVPRQDQIYNTIDARRVMQHSNGWADPQYEVATGRAPKTTPSKPGGAGFFRNFFRGTATSTLTKTDDKIWQEGIMDGRSAAENIPTQGVSTRNLFTQEASVCESEGMSTERSTSENKIPQSTSHENGMNDLLSDDIETLQVAVSGWDAGISDVASSQPVAFESDDVEVVRREGGEASTPTLVTSDSADDQETIRMAYSGSAASPERASRYFLRSQATQLTYDSATITSGMTAFGKHGLQGGQPPRRLDRVSTMFDEHSEETAFTNSISMSDMHDMEVLRRAVSGSAASPQVASHHQASRDEHSAGKTYNIEQDTFIGDERVKPSTLQYIPGVTSTDSIDAETIRRALSCSTSSPDRAVKRQPSHVSAGFHVEEDHSKPRIPSGEEKNTKAPIDRIKEMRSWATALERRLSQLDVHGSPSGRSSMAGDTRFEQGQEQVGLAHASSSETGSQDDMHDDDRRHQKHNDLLFEHQAGHLHVHGSAIQIDMFEERLTDSLDHSTDDENAIYNHEKSSLDWAVEELGMNNPLSLLDSEYSAWRLEMTTEELTEKQQPGLLSVDESSGGEAKSKLSDTMFVAGKPTDDFNSDSLEAKLPEQQNDVMVAATTDKLAEYGISALRNFSSNIGIITRHHDRFLTMPQPQKPEAEQMPLPVDNKEDITLRDSILRKTEHYFHKDEAPDVETDEELFRREFEVAIDESFNLLSFFSDEDDDILFEIEDRRDAKEALNLALRSHLIRIDDEGETMDDFDIDLLRDSCDWDAMATLDDFESPSSIDKIFTDFADLDDNQLMMEEAKLLIESNDFDFFDDDDEDNSNNDGRKPQRKPTELDEFSLNAATAAVEISDNLKNDVLNSFVLQGQSQSQRPPKRQILRPRMPFH